MSELTSNWQKLKQLTGLQWLVILQSPFVLLFNWRRLNRVGYRHSLEHIQLLSGAETPINQQLLLAEQITYALSIAIKFGPWSPRCLLRSLALAWFLARHGINFDIRIGVPQSGVMKQDDVIEEFIAHAWVEHAGIVLNDRPDIADTCSPFDIGSESL